MKQFSIVITIKKHTISEHRNEFEQFINIGLKSLDKFLDTDSLYALYIVSPASDLQEIASLIGDRPYNTVYLPDEAIIGEAQGASGWIKQQLIKLHVSRHIHTGVYIPLDGDHLLVKPLKWDDLFHDGKFTYSYEPWQTRNSEAYSTNSRWWMESCNLLQVSPSLVINQTSLMSVTPQILITSVVRELLDKLRHLYGDSYQDVMISNGFTEFTLYWIYSLSMGYTNLYTTEGIPLWKHDLFHNVLHRLPDVYRQEQLRLMFSEPPTFFAVIQSYLGIPIHQLIEETKPYLKN